MDSEKKSKAIYLRSNTYRRFSQLRQEFREKEGISASMNYVSSKLIAAYDENLDLKKEIAELKKEILHKEKENQEFFKQLLILQASRQTTSSSRMMPPPPTPQRLTIPVNSTPKPLRTPINIPNTGDIKKDYVKEIKTLFKGDIIRPSDVTKLTGFESNEIHDLPEDFEIPSIDSISSAKRFNSMVFQEA